MMSPQATFVALLVSTMVCWSSTLSFVEATTAACEATRTLLAASKSDDDPSTMNAQIAVPTTFFYPTFYFTPIHKQETNYTCGPASMLSALTALGFDNISEASLSTEMQTNSDIGTNLTQMLDAATRRGLVASLTQNATISDVVQAIGEGSLVIVLYQAWADEPNNAGANTWDSGHYSVVFGVDEVNVYLMDPWLGVYGYIPWSQFLNERWHAPDSFGAFDICQRCFLAMRIDSSRYDEKVEPPQQQQHLVPARIVPRPSPLTYIE